MNILFLTEKFPYPTDTGGKIRTFNILRGLSLEHNIVLLTTYSNDEQLKLINKLEEYCSEIHVVKEKKKSLGHLITVVIKNLFSNLPLLVHQHFNTAFSKSIQHIISRKQDAIQAVHFDHLDASMYLTQLNSIPLKVLDEHNVVTNQVTTSYQVEKNYLIRILLKAQIKKTRNFEAKAVTEMDLCLACSERDKEYLNEFAKTANISVIPNGVDVHYFSHRPESYPIEMKDFRNEDTLIFVGTLDYGPGETAVLYFLEKIYPMLRVKAPNIKLLFVGQNPSNRLLKYSTENIVFTGRVEDIRPYVAQASIFIVPLLSGSGTRLKILDAMAMKIPVVSTSLGAEGLEVTHGENIMLADSPSDFMTSILSLQKDSDLKEQLVENGYLLVNKKYAWEIVWRKLLKSYTNLDTKDNLVQSR